MPDGLPFADHEAVMRFWLSDDNDSDDGTAARVVVLVSAKPMEVYPKVSYAAILK